MTGAFLVGATGFLLATAAAPATGPADADRPNIIFILADDLGYGDLGCYGQKQIRTPNLDRLAAEGIRFTQCYAGSTVCAPSRCVLMTGLHTGHATIRGNGAVPLRPQDVTVAEVLKGAGYATGLVGKWGLGEDGTTGVPNDQGFDEFFGYLNQRHAHNYYPAFLWRNRRTIRLPGNVEKDGVSSRREQYSHDLLTREALDFIERHRGGPFFLYLAYTIPHANNERGRAEGNGMEVPSDEPYTDRPWPQTEKNKAAMITRLDADVGRLVRCLDELGLDRRTIIFFSSDNGPHREGGVRPEFFASSGPLRGIKRDLYEGGIRVPMIVRWKDTIRPNLVSDQVWAFWDFLPTAAELAGVKPPPGLDGISMVPSLLIGRPGIRNQEQHRFLYWEFHEGGFTQAVRMANWKAVRTAPGRPLELYDLLHDEAERYDVAPRYPQIVARMEECLQTARTDSQDWPVRSEAASSRPIRRLPDCPSQAP